MNKSYFFSHIEKSWLVWFIAILGIGLFQALPGPLYLDDAYITFRYARNISTGEGYVYNLDENVQGTTTPFYTLLLALLAKPIGAGNIPLISFVICLAADIVNTWLLYQVSRHLLKHDLAAFILAMVFLFHPFRLNVARGGMETSLFITLLLSMYYAYMIQRKLYLTVIFAALLVFVRIDGILAVFPVFVHALWKYKWETIKASSIACCILLPWFIWAYWYFGNPIPHSILAKVTAYPSLGTSSSLVFLLTFLGTGTIGPYRQLMVIMPGLIVALFLFIVFGLKWIKEGHQESLILISYPIIYYIVMGVQHVPLFFCWYYLPLMPGFLILFFGSLLYLIKDFSLNSRFLSKAVVLSLFGIALIALPAYLMRVLPGWADSREVEGLYRQTSVEIQDNVDGGSLVLAPDIGVIGWYLDDAAILDPIGLVSPVSLDYFDERSEGELVSMRLINDLKPDYIVSREEFIKNLTIDQQFQSDYGLIKQNTSTLNPTLIVLTYARK